MNQVCLIGRMTENPDSPKKLEGGRNVLNFTLAVKKNFKKDGDDADFIRCVAWENQADIISKYTKKGQLIGLAGRLQARSYTDENEIRHYVTEVVVRFVELLGNAEKKEPSEEVADFSDEDLPF